MEEMIVLDGTQGEGGGQILRSALSLSMITGRPLRVERVRGGRRKPGLMRQHLTCLRAAVEISGGRAEGDTLKSPCFSFWPGPVRGGDYVFAVGSAGSVSLVLQTLLPALLHADAPSTVLVQGGTHVCFSPSFHAFSESFVPLLRRMGAQVEVELESWGFNPAGGGAVRLHITPGALTPLSLMERGPISSCHVNVALSGVPGSVAQRELAVLCKGVNQPREQGIVHQVESPGPGNAMWVSMQHGQHCTVFDAIGAKGRRAEQVAGRLLRRLHRWGHAGVPVDEYLADQLLLPFALAGGGRLRSTALSAHSRTNMAVIQRFLEVGFAVKGREVVEVGVSGRADPQQRP